MGKSDEDYAGRERRQENYSDLRARLNEIAWKVSEHPELTEDDMSQLYELIRDYAKEIGPGNVSYDMLQDVREVYEDELSLALLELIDDVMARLG